MKTKTETPSAASAYMARQAAERARLVSRITELRPDWDQQAIEASGVINGNLHLQTIITTLATMRHLEKKFKNHVHPCGHCGRELVKTGDNCPGCGSHAECDPD